MRRFTITIPNQKTPIELLYNSEGILRKIDFCGLVLKSEGVLWFRNRIPVQVEHVFTAFEGMKVTVAEAELEITFEDFAREYPYKRNSHLARKYWPKMTTSQQMQAYYAAVDYRAYLSKPVNDWRTAKLPEKWLKDQEYLNNWKEL